MGQGLRQPDTLTHAFAVSANVAPSGLGEIHALNRLPRQLIRGLRITPCETKIRRDKLKPCQPLGKRIELRAVTDKFEQLLRFRRTHAEYIDTTTRRAH